MGGSEVGSDGHSATSEGNESGGSEGVGRRGTATSQQNKSRWGFLRDPTWDRWRHLAFFFGAACILLLAGLATSLGVFLSEGTNECGPPPRLANATTTYLGSATSGTQVSYVCQPPLVFPDNTDTFTITCQSDHRWDKTDIPSCAGHTERLCSYPTSDTEISLASHSYPDSLVVQVTIPEPVPTSLLLDIPADDHTHCSYPHLANNSQSLLLSWPLAFWDSTYDSFSRTGKSKTETHTITVTDTHINSREPYEVRVRSVGKRVAVSLLQEEYVKVELTTLDTTTTTTTTIAPNDSDVNSKVSAHAHTPPVVATYLSDWS